MRKTIFTNAMVLTMIAIFFIQHAALAQLTTQIGTGTQAPLTNNSIYSPICRFNATSTNDCSRSNLLYTATELTTAGITNGAVINKISFYKIGTGASTGNFTFSILMRNSSTVAPLTATPWATIIGTHTEVYSTTSQTIPATTGWIEFTLTTPFTYTGQSLEIAMGHDMTGITGSPSTGPFDWQYTSGFQDYIIGTVGTSSAGIPNLNGTVANYKVRPNILFSYTPTGTTPTTLTGTAALCANGTTTLTGSPSGGTYSSASPSIATVNSTTGVVTGVSAGSSLITYTNGTSTATLNVTVNALPAIPNAITGTTTLCIGNTTSLNSTSANGVWSSSNTSVAMVSTSGVVTGLSAGTSTISYTLTNAAGCSAATSTTVTVGTAPVVPAITGTLTLCTGTTTILSNTTTGGTWNSSNTAVATVNSTGTVTGVSAGTATISYAVTNAGGCTTTVNATVTVSGLPTVAPITGSASVCVGNTSNLSNVTSGGVWSSSNTAVATVSTSGVVSALTTGTTTISYLVTNAGGCSSSVDYLITVNPIPDVNAITGVANACVGATSSLANTSANGVWSSSNTQIATVNNLGVVSGVAAGTSNITYTITDGGCSASATIPFVVHAQPVPVISQSGSLLGIAVFASYSWSLNNNPIPGANSQTYAATANGSYTVTVTNANGCTGTSAPVVITGVAVENTQLKSNISIFPNPATDIINIIANELVNVTITTLDGRAITTINDAKTINVSNLADGLYLLKIIDKNNQLVSVEKIVKSSK